MNAIAVNNSITPPDAHRVASVASAGADRDKFTDLMRVSMDGKMMGTQSREQQVRDAANQLMSVAFIKPLLAQMHQSPFKTGMFDGGQGEKVFQEHLDTVLADRIAGRMNVSLGDAIYRKLMGNPSNPHAGKDATHVQKLDRHG